MSIEITNFDHVVETALNHLKKSQPVNKEGKMMKRNRRRLPMPPADRMILSVTEAAGLLGVGESTLRDMVRGGTIPHVRLGKRILFRRDVLLGLTDPDPTPAAGAAR